MSREGEIEIQIIDTKTGAMRYERGGPGATVALKASERVIDYWPVGVVRDGDPILTLKPRKAGS